MDWPLDGAVLDVQLISVVTHVADPDGLRAVELSVDGNRVASRAANGRFARRNLNWDPRPGEHVLIVAAVGTDGDRTASAPVQVRVEADDKTVNSTTTVPTDPTIPVTTTNQSTSTPLTATLPTSTTPRPATTTSPSASLPRPTTPAAEHGTTPATSPPTTSCTPTAPTATAPPNGTEVVQSATLRWTAAAGCSATSYRVDVSRDPAFARLEHTATVAHPTLSWSTPTLASCVTWYWRVAALGPTPGPWSATATFSTFLRGC
ncbi:MAG: hypothetical protein V9G12_02015 [Microthrixaceae bacterium]